jgi:hypothetical protein
VLLRTQTRNCRQRVSPIKQTRSEWFAFPSHRASIRRHANHSPLGTPESTTRSIKTEASNHARAISGFVLCPTDTQNANYATAGASPLNHRSDCRWFLPKNRGWWRNARVASGRSRHAPEVSTASVKAGTNPLGLQAGAAAARTTNATPATPQLVLRLNRHFRACAPRDDARRIRRCNVLFLPRRHARSRTRIGLSTVVS